MNQNKMQPEQSEDASYKRALLPLKIINPLYSKPDGLISYLNQSMPTKAQKYQNQDLKQVTVMQNTSPIKSSIKHGLTIDTRMIRNTEKFKNLMPVRFERSQRASFISNESLMLNRTDVWEDQRLPDIQDYRSKRKKVSTKAVIIEEQPPPTLRQWKLRNVSPTELIKISLAFHGQLQGGPPPRDYMEMLRECRRLTPSSNSRYGRTKFFSPRDSRYSTGFFISPNNSKGFNSSREDDSPLRRKIAARNERQASTGVENLFASDFSTIQRIRIENEAAEQARQPRYKQPTVQKKKHLQPTNSEKRAINRMFSKKSQESGQDIKQDPGKAKITFNAPNIKISSIEHSFIDRQEQKLNKDLVKVRKPLEKILSIGVLEDDIEYPTVADVPNETKRSLVAKEMAMHTQAFMQKSAFQQGIQHKLNRLDYLKLQKPIVAKHFTIQPNEIKHYQTKIERPMQNLSQTVDEKRALPASPFRQKVQTKKINRSSQNGSSFYVNLVDLSQSELEFESRLLKRPEKPTARADLRNNIMIKISSSLTIPDAPFSRASLMPSFNKRYKQHKFESSTASLSDIYVTKGTSRQASIKQSQTISPAKLLGSREIAESLQSQLLTHSAIYIA